jgi:hypothetical protein
LLPSHARCCGGRAGPSARLQLESRLHLHVSTEIGRPPRDRCGLRHTGAGRLTMLTAVNRDRFRCIEPGIRGEFLWASSPLDGVQNGCAARCGGGLHKSAKYLWQSAKQHAATVQSPDLRFTSDIVRGMRSRAQRRSCCEGLCERRIDDLDRMGIRRHLWRRASAMNRPCTTASLGPQGIKASLASGHTASRGR